VQGHADAEAGRGGHDRADLQRGEVERADLPGGEIAQDHVLVGLLHLDVGDAEAEDGEAGGEHKGDHGGEGDGDPPRSVGPRGKTEAVVVGFQGAGVDRVGEGGLVGGGYSFGTARVETVLVVAHGGQPLAFGGLRRPS
jgi:hypothetical protein